MRILLLAAFALASCGDAVPVGNAARADNAAHGDAERDDAPEPMPVRIGEQGPNFKACTAAGTTRNLGAAETLPVRKAPFDYAGESGAVRAGSRFFVCSRSLDEKWFGIVWDEGGRLSERCGVSTPVTRRRNYDGPCRSGWVQSAFVKLIAGLEQPEQENQPAVNGASGS